MDLRQRRGLIGSKGSVVPDGYEKLEYIQKQGTTAQIRIYPAYFQMELNDTIKLKMSCLQNAGTQCFMGRSDQWDAEIRAGGNLGEWYGVKRRKPSTPIVFNKIYDWEYYISDSRGRNGANFGTYRDGGGSYPFYGRFYRISILRDGQKMVDLIPAKRLSDGAVGMYETIQGQFLTSPHAAFEAPEQEG